MKTLIYWEGPGWYVEVADDDRPVWYQISDQEEVRPVDEDCFWWDEIPEWAHDAQIVNCW